MQERIDQAAGILIESRRTISLTGAGVSVESGIPDFRSAGGLWSRFDPGEYATISAFMANPGKVWEMLREMESVIDKAQPNPAHVGLGELESMGLLECVITQNVDNLHQEGGSKTVIEYHGNARTLSCLECGRQYSADERGEAFPPQCECGKILKPDVVFFGEAIPPDAMNRSFRLASSAEALMVVGTSAAVSPANTIPSVAKQNGAKVIEINKERTHLTEIITDVFLQGSAGEIVSELVKAVKDKKGAA